MDILRLTLRRRKRTYVLAALVLLPLLVWAFLRLQAVNGSFTRPDFDRIQPGMTLAEVKEILGPSAELVCLNPSLHQQYIVKWDSWSANAIVNFDPAGRVFAHGGKDYIPSNRTYRDKFRSWWYLYVGANPPF